MTDQVFDQVREYVSAVPVTDEVRERARVKVDSLVAGNSGDDFVGLRTREPGRGWHSHVVPAGARFKVVVAAAASLVVVLGIVLAAHGSSSPKANSTRPRPVASTTVPPTTSTVAASFPPCTKAQLSVSVGSYGEAGGMYAQTFMFTNRSDGTCQTGGWPGFQALSASGQPVRTTQHVRQNAPPAPASTTIDLRPGAKASFDIYNSDWNHIENTACPDTSAVRITPPGAGSYISVRIRIPACFTFDVAPVIAGATDNRAWSVVVS